MPYGIDKKFGGDNPANVSFMERCVSDIKGTNKRTGKPYTKGEKIAICKTSLKNRKEKNSSLEEVILEESLSAEKEELEKKMDECHRRMMKTGKAKTMEEAHELCQKYLSQASFDLHRMEFILDLNLAINRV